VTAAQAVSPQRAVARVDTAAVARDARGTKEPRLQLADALSIVAIDDPADLEPFIAEWEALASDAAVPNPFYEPWMLLPAMRLLKQGQLRIVLVLGEVTSPVRRRVVCGVIPLECHGRSTATPVARYSMWKHRYCFLCTPLLRSGFETECLDALFEWLSHGPSAVLEFGHVDGHGPFDNALAECLNRRRLLSFTSLKAPRAALMRSEPDAECYEQRVLDGKRRKNYRRQASQLAGTGTLETSALGVNDDVHAWIEEFIEIEASGWKGVSGTAFAARTQDSSYFREIAAAAAERGQLRMMALRLNGRAVAMRCVFRSSATGFLFKIAYDEQYSSFSPGALLELQALRDFYADPRDEFLDSCADSDHFMLNRLWRERRSIQTSLVAVAGWPAQALVSLMPLARFVARTLRGMRRPAHSPTPSA
jgi:CelD/BcsL family acetyltransferase involved in cellulose biosynthesis